MNDKSMQAVQAEMSPQIAAFDDEITQNEALFARIKAVYDARNKSGLKPDELRLVETVYRNFARKGAALSKPDKDKLKQINKQLASLFTKFQQNELADEESYTLTLESEADLAGPSAELPQHVAEGAGREHPRAEEAAARLSHTLDNEELAVRGRRARLADDDPPAPHGALVVEDDQQARTGVDRQAP